MAHPKFEIGNDFGKGRKPKSWCYTLQDIAKKRGVKVSAVRKAIERNTLDPTNLDSVAAYIAARNQKEE